MSVIVNFSIFPIGKGESLSEYAAGSLKIIKESGIPYNFGPMGTSIEGEWDEVMGVVSDCFQSMSKECGRIYISMNADFRQGKSERLSAKVDSVNALLEK